MRFNVKFSVFAKIVVTGARQHPLYQYLTEAKPEAQSGPDSSLRTSLEKKGVATGKPEGILWNFEKFLVSHRGEAVARFAPDVTPENPLLIKAIEIELSKD